MKTITLRNSIHNSLLRLVLFRGVLLSLIGTGLLFYGITLPVERLQYLGLPILICSGALFSFGLAPYRKLKAIEKSPYELSVFENQYCVFSTHEKQLLKIPVESILRSSFLANGNRYGIGMWLKENEKVILLDPHFDLANFQKTSQKQFQCTLFLPYFSQRSHKTFVDFIDQ